MVVRICSFVPTTRGATAAAIAIVLSIHGQIALASRRDIVGAALAEDDDRFSSTATVVALHGDDGAERSSTNIIGATSGGGGEQRRLRRWREGEEPPYGAETDDNRRTALATTASKTTTRSLKRRGGRELAAPCGALGWHPEVQSGKQDGCSNDDVHPPDWADAAMRETMFYPTAGACCDAFFGKYGLPCKSYECAGGGGEPAGPPSSSSACAWHVDMQSEDGCSNDDSYPEEWLDGASVAMMFHASAQDCCASWFAGPCEIYDRGCSFVVSLGDGPDPAPAPTPVEVVDCKAPGWHADMGGARDGCTNDENFPDVWLDSDSMFFASAKQCCDLFFKGKNCKEYDRGCRIDTSMIRFECDGPSWHPERAGRAPGCTNSADYPKEWDGDRGFMFGTGKACCDVHHPNKSCAVRDGCTNEITYLTPKTQKPTARPTNIPTARPTHRPTKPPTRSPSKPPTSPPSASPTVRPLAFYIIHGDGRCIDDRIIPKPYYIEQTWEEHKTCCHHSWARAKCVADMLSYLAEGETGAPVGRTTPAPTGSPTTPWPVLDTVVEITAWGSLQIENLAVPGAAQDWQNLEHALSRSIYHVVTQIPICHPGLKLTMSTYGGQGFLARRRRRLGGDASNDGEFEDGRDRDEKNSGALASSRRQETRRATAGSQPLQFVMTVPARCDEACQMAYGHPGKLAFDEIESFFQQYIEAGVLTSTLVTIGGASDLFDAEEGAPVVTSGTLSYRHGAPSSITWIPTFMPSVAVPTSTPTLSPSEVPTEARITAAPTTAPTPGSDAPSSSPTPACLTLRWHYGGEGKCTNYPDYPLLWDLRPAIGSHFLHDTPEDCCFANSPEGCVVTDACDAESSPPGYCGARDAKYHPTTPGERTCINNEDYPAAWNDSDRFLFASAADCCAAFYGDGLCFVKDVCYWEMNS